MEVLIQSLDADVSNNFKKEIRKKIQSAGRIFSRVISVDIKLFKENNDEQNDYCMEAKIIVPQNVLFAKERAESFKAALNNLLDSIKHQLVKYKEKLEEVRSSQNL